MAFRGGGGREGDVGGGLGVLEVRDPDAEGLPVPQRQQDVSLGLFPWMSDLVRLCVCDGVQGRGRGGGGEGEVGGGLGVLEVRDPDAEGPPVPHQQQDVSFGLFCWLSEVGGGNEGGRGRSRC